MPNPCHFQNYDQSMSQLSSGWTVGWQLCTLPGHSGHVYSVAFSSDGKRVVSGSHDNLLKIWEAETGAEVRSLMRILLGREEMCFLTGVFECVLNWKWF